jgi:ribonuclease D
MAVYFHERDLPADHGLGAHGAVAVDTETMGLSLTRDALCLVQLSSGDGDAHIVRPDRTSYDCPNLKALLADSGVQKIFHYARFDLAMIRTHLGVEVTPVFCTKIASRLARTYTDRHGLKDLARELVGLEMNKQQQSSDWGAAILSPEQLDYAASDVLYLHRIRDALIAMLTREGRLDLAQQCFAFLPARARLDLAGWNDVDIFAHS